MTGLVETDPFELPDWLGTSAVTWSATSGLDGGARVAGLLSAGAGQQLPCDLLAVDRAYPTSVVDDHVRVRAHQQWQHGQVLLLGEGQASGPASLVLAVPGSVFAADLVIQAVTRLALAVGAPVSQYAVHLQLGR